MVIEVILNEKKLIDQKMIQVDSLQEMLIIGNFTIYVASLVILNLPTSLLVKSKIN
jgi:hypothetical protein